MSNIKGGDMNNKIPVLVLGDAPEKDRQSWFIWDKPHIRSIILKASFDELIDLIRKEK